MELQSLYVSVQVDLCTELCRCGAGRSQDKFDVLLMPLRLIKSRKGGCRLVHRQKQGHIKEKRNVFNFSGREEGTVFTVHVSYYLIDHKIKIVFQIF